MFYSVDGKIVQVGGAFTERRVNKLTFQVAGTQFPDFTSSTDSPDLSFFSFDSNSKNSVTVNWGDGIVETLNFNEINSSLFKIGWTANGQESGIGSIFNESLAGLHVYQDGYTGVRNITFEFKSLSNILSNTVRRTRLYNVYPDEIGFAKSLDKINISGSLNLNVLPDSLMKIEGIRNISLSSAFVTKLNVIPDSFFKNPLENLAISNSFNLSNNISSNFFKIKQLKETLTFLDCRYSNIINFPAELGECINIKTLRALGNSCINADSVSQLINIRALQIDFDTSVTEINIFQNLSLLESLYLKADGYNLQNIVIDWVGLKSLKDIIVFSSLVSSNGQFDTFIDAFYSLCTENAYLDPLSAPIEEDFPEQFRDISWGHSSLTQTGAIQAPTGYDPNILFTNTNITQGEKIYVLVNQLGHTVTTA